jgi:hypothetical protein
MITEISNLETVIIKQDCILTDWVLGEAKNQSALLYENLTLNINGISKELGSGLLLRKGDSVSLEVKPVVGISNLYVELYLILKPQFETSGLKKTTLTKKDLKNIDLQALELITEMPATLRLLEEFTDNRMKQAYSYTVAVITHLKNIGALKEDFEYQSEVKEKLTHKI